MAKKQSRITSYIYLLINTLSWGAFLPIVKWGFSSMTPFRYLLYRYALAAFLSVPIIMYFWPRIHKKILALKRIFFIELLGTTLALSFLYTGLNKTSALEANLIATTLPIFLTLGGIFFLCEKEEKQEWIGLVISFIGTLFLVIEPLFFSASHVSGSFMGNMFVIVHNLLTTAYFLLAKKYYSQYPKLFVSSISFFVGLLSFAAFSLAETQFSLSAFLSAATADFSSFSTWMVVGYAAIFGSLIGYTAYIKGQDGIEASEASLFAYLQPAVYIPVGYLLLREKVTPLQVIALIIVITGVIVAQRRKKRN